MEVNAEQQSEGIDNLRRTLEERNRELTELRAKYRSLQAETAFKEASLNPKHAELFLKVVGDGEDITAKAVKDFAKEYNLAPVASAPEPSSTQQPESNPNQPEGQAQQPNPQASLAEMAGAGSGPAGVNPPSSPGPMMSQADFQKLLQTDKTAALRAYTEGRVQTVDGNVFAEQAKQKGLIE